LNLSADSKGILPEALPVGEEAKAKWEEKRSIATVRERDDYFDEWAAEHGRWS